jgi:Protein of unknown function (DUF3072)
MADNTQKDPKDWVSGDDPMTDAQASYLKTLTEQAHQRVDTDNLTKAEASELIDELKPEALGNDDGRRELAPHDQRRPSEASRPRR